MAYEIDIVFIAPNCGNELELLNAKAALGWEPYAVSGNNHYFKKQWMQGYIPYPSPKQMAHQLGMTEGEEEIPIPHGSDHKKIVKRIKRDFKK
jgi:hypothetical protein